MGQLGTARLGGTEHPTDLSREDVALAWDPVQRLAIAPLAVPDAIHRRRVEIIQAQCQAALDESDGFCFRRGLLRVRGRRRS